ncbi:5030_t:CDS:1, partial [Scutellospora calospora]
MSSFNNSKSLRNIILTYDILTFSDKDFITINRENSNNKNLDYLNNKNLDNSNNKTNAEKVNEK